MASGPRSDVFREGEVGVYHCYNRCVRQAFLCGSDPELGTDYEYRRLWIADFEQELARYYGVEVCFHAELVNHLHVILRVRPDVVETWSDEEAVRRWLTISLLVRSKDGRTIKPLKESRIKKELRNAKKVAKTRRKLASISNFMGSLCEHVSRRCNREEGRKGTFWEGRFKCQDLADEAAILCCGVYVDLNQVRALEAPTPELSRHTSAYDRLTAWEAEKNLDKECGSSDAALEPAEGSEAPSQEDAPQLPIDGWLCELTLAAGPDAEISTCSPAASGRRASDKGLLPISREEYFELLDVTGRILRSDKPGAIAQELPPILERLEKRGLSVKTTLWVEAVKNFATRFGHVVGRGAAIVDRAARVGRKWFCGRHACEEAFG